MALNSSGSARRIAWRNLQVYGINAVRGYPLVVPNLPLQEELDEHTLDIYTARLNDLFTAATQEKATEWYRVAAQLVTSAHAVVGYLLVRPDDEAFELVAKTSCEDVVRDLKILHPRRWHERGIREALELHGAAEFRGKWAPFIPRFS